MGKRASRTSALGVGILLFATLIVSLGIGVKAGYSLYDEEMHKMREVISGINNYYVEKDVSTADLVDNAIRGMLNGLDPYSRYYTAEEFRRLDERLAGKFGGIGIEISTDKESGYIKIVSVLSGSPAEKAGILPNDLITDVGEETIQDMPLSEVVKRLRGEPDTPVDITLKREGRSLTVTIIRAIVVFRNVETRTLLTGYAYIKIATFDKETISEEVEQALAAIVEEHEPLKGLVIDLRGNLGGFLRETVKIADFFLGDGIITKEVRYGKETQRTESAVAGDLTDGAPIVLLVNGRSASGAEIFAAALQDNDRAVVVGSKTFGKGLGQSFLHLGDGSVVSLSMLELFSPKGAKINGVGITPDIDVTGLEVGDLEERERIYEKDLYRRLDNPNTENAANRADETKKEEVPSFVRKDIALHEALMILRGNDILKSK